MSISPLSQTRVASGVINLSSGSITANWTNPLFAKLPDADDATVADGDFDAGGHRSSWLIATDFKFDWPTGANVFITGLMMHIVHYNPESDLVNSTGTPQVYSTSVRIVKNNNIQFGLNPIIGLNGVWPSSQFSAGFHQGLVYPFAGDDMFWNLGSGWQYTDVNASGFGWALQVSGYRVLAEWPSPKVNFFSGMIFGYEQLADVLAPVLYYQVGTLLLATSGT